MFSLSPIGVASTGGPLIVVVDGLKDSPSSCYMCIGGVDIEARDPMTEAVVFYTSRG